MGDYLTVDVGPVGLALAGWVLLCLAVLAGLRMWERRRPDLLADALTDDTQSYSLAALRDRLNQGAAAMTLKRTPMVRYTPLRRSQVAGLRRIHAMKSLPRRRSTAAMRVALAARSDGWCELQVPGVCVGRAVDPCHRRGSKHGGRHGAAAVEHDQLSNVLHGCRPCHDWQTTAGNRPLAEQLGWVVREGAAPAQVSVFYRGRMALLGDDGSVTR